ncbi:MAG: UDP-N-acetylmuramate--L-alanine ligase [Phycisphaeraceae bacterium]|nr:MAG: UDP-N-acetylmuramate--L-alanine ligase [Phycisphaeraceae bacterium]
MDPRPSTRTKPVEVACDPLGIGGAVPHMVGIGGCGMSALAKLLASSGVPVRGTDMGATPVTDSLTRAGIEVGFEQTAGALGDDADVVIASAAVGADHAEVVAARDRGIPVLSYAQALGRCQAGRTGVSVAGTHGKSTTSAMLGCALTDAGIDPAVIVGATCAQLSRGALTEPGEKTGFRLGSPTIQNGEWGGRPGVLLAEACEYNRSFHHHRPTVASIGVIEPDHLDIYSSLDEIVEAFRGFAQLVPDEADGGRLLIAHEGAHRTQVAAGLTCRVETIGFSPAADYVIGFDPSTRRVSVSHEGAELGAWVNTMAGEHNATNAATAFALGVILGADPQLLGASLGAFGGLDRRLQMIGEADGVRVYDDYGHHPTEIARTLEAVRQSDDPAERGGRLITVFQPHQHSRTRFLMEEFATSFEQADIVIVPDIYFVRDTQAERHKVSAADLVDRLRSRGVRAMHLYPFDAIVEQLSTLARPGDVVLVMGAGPVWKVAHGFLGAHAGAVVS